MRRGGGVGGSSLARRPGAHPTCAARRARRCATTRRMVVRGGGCRRPPGGTRPWLGEEVGGGRGRESVPARPPHPSPQPSLLAVGGPPFRAVDSTFFFFFFSNRPGAQSTCNCARPRWPSAIELVAGVVVGGMGGAQSCGEAAATRSPPPQSAPCWCTRACPVSDDGGGGGESWGMAGNRALRRCRAVPRPTPPPPFPPASAGCCRPTPSRVGRAVCRAGRYPLAVCVAGRLVLSHTQLSGRPLSCVQPLGPPPPPTAALPLCRLTMAAEAATAAVAAWRKRFWQAHASSQLPPSPPPESSARTAESREHTPRQPASVPYPTPPRVTSTAHPHPPATPPVAASAHRPTGGARLTLEPPHS